MKQRLLILWFILSVCCQFQMLAQTTSSIFNDYPWLSNLVQPTACSSETVAVYQAGIYSYLLVTDASGNAILYNQDGLFYCQNSSNYDCVAAYRLGAPTNTWTCVDNSSSCAVTLFNNECIDVGIYDENDNFLGTIAADPKIDGQFSTWEDPNPLSTNIERTYFFKDNNFVIGSRTISCASLNSATVVNNGVDYCGSSFTANITNVGCRTITIQNTRGDALQTVEPDDVIDFEVGNAIFILLVEQDTIAVIQGNPGLVNFDSGGCGDNSNGGCATVIDPVCGVDGNTYNNECEATRAGVAVAFDSPCNIDPADQCAVTITNTQCRRIGVYDTSNRLLTTINRGPMPNGPPGSITPEWTDPNPLVAGETRTYILKEGNFILTSKTATCQNKNLTTSNSYATGCRDGLSLGIFTNTGCRAMTIFNTSSEIIGILAPAQSVTFTVTNNIYIFLVGNDTIDIKSDVGGDINSGGCEGTSNCDFTLDQNEIRQLERPNTNCSQTIRISEINYNGSTYIRRTSGRTRTSIERRTTPCAVQEYFGDIRDCEGNIICEFALRNPPPNFDPVVCDAIQRGEGTETVLWEHPENNCSVEDPFSLAALQRAVTSDQFQVFDGDTCLFTKEIIQFSYLGFTYFRINNEVYPGASCPRQNGSTFINCTGDFLGGVGDVPSCQSAFVCNALDVASASGTVIWSAEEEQGSSNAQVFMDYPWLTNFVNPTTCSSEKIEVYQTGIYNYLLITDANGVAKLYNQDGLFYCQNSTNYDCVAAYNLGSPIDSWTCNGSDGGCAAVVDPVCGVDGITYNNECEAARAGVAIAYNTACNIDPPATCAFEENIDSYVNQIQNQQIACFAPIRVTQLSYQGVTYFKTDIGRNRTSLETLDDPCPAQELFEEYRDCSGTVLCRVGNAALPPEPILTLCNNLRALSGTIIWEDSGISCSVEDPFTLPFIQRIVQADQESEENCIVVEEIVQIEFLGYTYFRVKETASTTGTCGIAGTALKFYDCEGKFVGGRGDVPNCQSDYLCVNLEFAQGTVIWTPSNGQETGNDTRVFQDYPWLGGLVDFSNCTGISVEVYDAGSYDFIFVRTGPETGKLYLETGSFYCESASNYDCIAAYQLTNLVATWSCSSIMEAAATLRTKREMALPTLSVFPNPTTGNLSIRLLDHDEEQHIRIINLLGNTVYQQVVLGASTLSVDLSNYEDGLYLMEWTSGSQSQTKKILKQGIK